MLAIFLPSSWRPFAAPLATDFRPFQRLSITPIVVPTASKTVTLKPYFLKISLFRSRKDSPSLRRSLIYQRVSLLGHFLNLFTGAFSVSISFIFVICNILLLLDVFVNFFNLFVFLLNQSLAFLVREFP